jgi:hypothetical protein
LLLYNAISLFTLKIPDFFVILYDIFETIIQNYR